MDKCLGVSDVGLAKIVVGCGRLVRLSLKWCMEISDLGVELLCKKCLELKFLDVSYLKVCLIITYLMLHFRLIYFSLQGYLEI
jgi:F-box/leucine-rich repeat protein 2/20